MSKIKNLQNEVTEQVKNVWVLTARSKKSKSIVNFICKDGDATNEAVASLKTAGLSFITLTTEGRIRSFLSGNPVKAWKSNESALNRRGVDIKGLYDKVLAHLDCTTEAERWVDANGNPCNWYKIEEGDEGTPAEADVTPSDMISDEAC